MVKKQGFTLIELLVVISIIGLLSTLGVISLNSARVKARDAKRITDMKNLKTAIEIYATDSSTGSYPTPASWTELSGTDANGIGAYLPKMPQPQVGSESYIYWYSKAALGRLGKYYMLEIAGTGLEDANNPVLNNSWQGDLTNFAAVMISLQANGIYTESTLDAGNQNYCKLSVNPTWYCTGDYNGD